MQQVPYKVTPRSAVPKVLPAWPTDHFQDTHRASLYQGQTGRENRHSKHPCLYLVTRSLDPTGKSQARWTMRWNLP